LVLYRIEFYQNSILRTLSAKSEGKFYTNLYKGINVFPLIDLKCCDLRLSERSFDFFNGVAIVSINSYRFLMLIVAQRLLGINWA